jgi:hypothetical protein
MSTAADPAYGVEAVVLDTNLNVTSRALYVGVGGNVNVVASDGSTALFFAVPAGTVLPVRIRRVLSASTTAANMVALY